MSAKRGHRSWGHIRKLDSGRFQASFVGPDLKRYNGPVTFDSRVMAEGWLARQREKIQLAAYNGSVWVSPVAAETQEKITGESLADYATEWIKNRTNIKTSTKLLYGDVLKNHIAPTLGQTAIGGLSTQLVAHWYSRLPADKPRVRSQAYSLLHAICGTAVENELLAKNPCAIKGASNTTRKRQPVLLTVDELARVADEFGPRLRVMVLLSGFCALRFGEATELQRKDIGEGCETITISRAVTHRQSDDGRCRIGTTKSGKGRTIGVPPHIRADIKHHLDTNVGPQPEALLFASARGSCNHWQQNSFREQFVKACKKAGRENVTVHDLRHFGATMTARAGATVAEVQARLGHSNYKTAMAYQHSEATRQDEIADAISRLATRPKLAVVANESSESA